MKRRSFLGSAFAGVSITGAFAAPPKVKAGDIPTTTFGKTGVEVSRLPLLLRLALLIGCAVVVVAQTEHITAFTGTWKLNLEKSRFNPGPPFKSFTLTFAPDGSRKLDLIGADGQPLKASLPWSDGKEVVVAVTEGMGNVTATSRIQGRTFDDTWTEDGKIIERFMVSCPRTE